MKITAKDVIDVEHHCLADRYRDMPPDAPRPDGGVNRFGITFLDEEGATKFAVCINTRYENYVILRRLYPDLQMETAGNYMVITDPRVGEEWLCAPRWW